MNLNIHHINDDSLLPEGLLGLFSEVKHNGSGGLMDELNNGLGEDVLACPLDRVPVYSKAYGWVIAATVKRSFLRAQIVSKEWQEGQELWVPENASLFCPNEILLSQILAQRPDVVAAPDLQLGMPMVIDPFEGRNNVGQIREIHPAEITPAPGFGTIALICSNSERDIRRSLLRFHDHQTMICTNIERSIQRSLSDQVDLLAAHCENDRRGRYQLHMYSTLNGSHFRDRLIQDSWAGMEDQAISRIKSGLGL